MKTALMLLANACDRLVGLGDTYTKTALMLLVTPVLVAATLAMALPSPSSSQSPFAYQPPDLYRESDHRVMQNVRPFTSDTDTFLKIRPLYWEKTGSSVTYLGLRGDEAYFQVGPHAVRTGGPNPETDPYRIDYGLVGVFTLAEVQKLITRVNQMEAEIQLLKQPQPVRPGRPAR